MSDATEWTDKWNELPLHIRKIGSKCETAMRINQLLIEKERVKKYYRRHIAEIDAHISDLKNRRANDED